MEDANFEDLLLKGSSWNVHESNIHTLLIEIHESNQYLKPVLLDMVHKHSVLKVA